MTQRIWALASTMPDPTPTSPELRRRELGAARLSLGVGIALLGLKFAAFLVSGSAAIFSDAMESIVNVLASGVALYALIVAHRGADDEHPYGHGKIEFLSAGFEGGMILLAAFAIIAKAVDALYHGLNEGPRLHQEGLSLGLGLMAVAMLANGGMGLFLVRRGRRGGSLILEADGHHLISDAITSAGVLAAVAVVKAFPWLWFLDPITAMVMALYITAMAWGLLKRAGAGLMDEQDLRDATAIEGILKSHMGSTGLEPRICSFHKLRHRHSGRWHWVDFHLLVPASLCISEGHDIASAIEYEIERMLGQGLANATAHIEPCTAEDCPGCRPRP